MFNKLVVTVIVLSVAPAPCRSGKFTGSTSASDLVNTDVECQALALAKENAGKDGNPPDKLADSRYVKCIEDLHYKTLAYVNSEARKTGMDPETWLKSKGTYIQDFEAYTFQVSSGSVTRTILLPKSMTIHIGDDEQKPNEKVDQRYAELNKDDQPTQRIAPKRSILSKLNPKNWKISLCFWCRYVSLSDLVKKDRQCEDLAIIDKFEGADSKVTEELARAVYKKCIDEMQMLTVQYITAKAKKLRMTPGGWLQSKAMFDKDSDCYMFEIEARPARSFFKKVKRTIMLPKTVSVTLDDSNKKAFEKIDEHYVELKKQRLEQEKEAEEAAAKAAEERAKGSKLNPLNWGIFHRSFWRRHKK